MCYRIRSTHTSVRFRDDLLEKSSEEKDLGVLVDDRLTMSQLCVFAVLLQEGF